MCAARPGAPERASGRAAGRIVLALLALAAAAVVFLLPALVPAPEPDAGPREAAAPSPDAAPEARDTAAPGAASGPDETPWTDARRQAARRRAQDVLARAREVEQGLLDRRVETWDDPRLTRAYGQLTAGDRAYRERDYDRAAESYLLALGTLEALRQDADARVEAALTSAGRALAAGDAEPAREALETLRRFAPDHPDLGGLRERLRVLPEVEVLLRRGADLAEARDYEGAVAALQEAAALDPAVTAVQEDLRAYRQRRAEQRFLGAMSRGYRALDEARFDAAASAFATARGLRPDDPEVDEALRQLDALRTQDRLSTLRGRAVAAEAREDWSAAAEAWASMLAVDDALLDARQGLDRSRDLAETVPRARAWIDDPASLATDADREAAATILRRWRAYDLEGPELARLARDLQETLRMVREPVPVELLSDDSTEVVLLRSGPLGAFARRRVELLPGTYVLRGSRVGYRDVRVTLEVPPGSAPLSVRVACTEPIGGPT